MSLPEDDFDRLLEEEREIIQEESNIESMDAVGMWSVVDIIDEMENKKYCLYPNFSILVFPKVMITKIRKFKVFQRIQMI